MGRWCRVREPIAFVTPVQPSLVASSMSARAIWTSLVAVLSNGCRLACSLLPHEPNAVLAKASHGDPGFGLC